MATLASLQVPSIYPSLMLRRGHGYPLWLPEPISNLPPDCVRHGTQIGDLGYLADNGGFNYLFNVFKDAEDPVNLNWHSVPHGFVPLKVDPTIREELEFHDKNSVATMSGVERRSAGIFFKSTSSITRGAVLTLPDGAERYDCEHPGILGEYAAANAHSWYKYYNGEDQGMGIRNGTLYLVTGCDKARSWNAKRYAQSSSASTFALARVFRYRNEKQIVSGVDERSHEREMTPDARPNQTIFLRGYSISVRTKSWMLGNRDVFPYQYSGLWTGKELPDHRPSASVNDYILGSYFGATVAVTHDHYMGMVNSVRKPLKAVELANDFTSSTDLVFITKSSGTGGAWIANRGFTDVLGYQHRTLNSKDAETLQELTGCAPEEAKSIIGLRPHLSVRARLRRWCSGVEEKKKTTFSCEKRVI